MMAMKKSSSGGFVGVVWLIMGIQLVAVAVAAQVSGKEVDEKLDFWKTKTVFVLGDSTLDVGNNNYLKGKDVFRASKPYWGIDYWPSFFNPTGRFSNGYNVADYISMKLGLASSPPAYLSLMGLLNFTLVSRALSTGVSFASGGAGILDSTNIGQCIPLSTQMKNMELTRAAIVSRVGERSVTDLFARSFFLVGIGKYFRTE